MGMVAVCIRGRMVHLTMASMPTTRSMASASLHGLMAKPLKVFGIVASSMALEHFAQQTATFYKKTCGSTEKYRDCQRSLSATCVRVQRIMLEDNFLCR